MRENAIPVFADVESSFEVIPSPADFDASTLPQVVGAVAPRSLIVRVGEEPGYRVTARTPIATTGATATEAVAPLRSRGIAVLAVVALTSLSSITALMSR